MQEQSQESGGQDIISSLKGLYNDRYKKLLIIPIVILALAIAQIAFQTSATGDFIRKDVSLKGGLTVSVLASEELDIDSLESSLSSDFPGNDISVRSLKASGATTGVIITADMEGERSDELLSSVEDKLGIKLTSENHTIEIMGSALGASFFHETFKALYIAFLFMGMVVFIYFGKGIWYKVVSVIASLIAAYSMLAGKSITTDIIAYVIGIALMMLYFTNSIPSIAIIAAAVSDLIITLAVVNLLGIKVSTAGIAAFLMLIGYSVDTNMLLSTRLLRRREGNNVDRIFGAMKTGLMMTATTLVAVTAALIFTGSDVISQIMTIVLIGLIVDMMSTWVQNSSILLWYTKKNEPQS